MHTMTQMNTLGVGVPRQIPPTKILGRQFRQIMLKKVIWSGIWLAEGSANVRHLLPMLPGLGLIVYVNARVADVLNTGAIAASGFSVPVLFLRLWVGSHPGKVRSGCSRGGPAGS